MDYKHREIIKKYTHTLQQSINLHDMKDSLRKSKIFTTHMIKAIYDGEASFFEELPTRGPDAFYRFINLLETNEYDSIAKELRHVANPAYRISDQHGYHFILLNCDYEGILSFEELNDIHCGCELEAQALELALRRIGFENHKFKMDLTSCKLKSSLIKFSKIDKNVNSCIVIILGLGAIYKDSKIIYCRDGKFVFLHDIVNLFSDTNCPSLKYKPKIFLLSSFDVSHNDSVENVKISPNVDDNVNDTFLWYFPSVKNYKLIKEKNLKFFGQILSKNLKDNYLESDFESIFKSAYQEFKSQFLEEKDLIIPECERLGNCREKIFFASTS